MIDRTNVIGILGGKSTLCFAQKLVDQEIKLPMILQTDPTLSNELLLLDRSSFPFLSAKPFLHMGESVAKELKEAKLKPIVAGSSICIGVLATNTTLAARMYQEKLEKQADNRIILASDELLKLLPPNDSLWRQCIDPTDALVRSTIKCAQSANKES